MSPTVAIIARDESARLAIVKALDRAPADWVLELHRDPPTHADVVVCERETDVEGGIVFDGERDDLISQIAARIVPCARTLLVTSPSGGTGVTSVALHLAVEFSYRGHETGVLDLGEDQGVRGRLGLEPSTEARAPVPVPGGFRLLSRTEDTTGFGKVIIDAPRRDMAGVSSVDKALLICSPSPEGGRRARSMLEDLPDLDWTIVLNRVGPGGETTRSRFQSLVEREVFELCCCAALRDAEDEGRLLTRGWTRWSRAIAKLAGLLDAD